jgi:putative transposase
VFAGQKVGMKEEADGIWQVSFMRYEIGYFDLETCRVEPVNKPFGPKVLTMRQQIQCRDANANAQREEGARICRHRAASWPRLACLRPRNALRARSWAHPWGTN